jgi:hypothetical protein
LVNDAFVDGVAVMGMLTKDNSWLAQVLVEIVE